MSEKETKVTKQETLAALRNPGELYVIMSAATKMPFVKCDEETFDDEIFLYYQMEDAKDKARKLLDEKYAPARITAPANAKSQFAFGGFSPTFSLLSISIGRSLYTDTSMRIIISRKIARNRPTVIRIGFISI